MTKPAMMPTRSNVAAIALICALIAGVLTVVVLRFSFSRGRLSLYPRFDDIGYMNEGMGLWESIKADGLAVVGKQWIQNPPHSPYSTFMAAAAFAIFGPHDWAPYATNGLLVFAFLLCAERLLKGLDFWTRAACLIFVATAPLTALMVHEFRPDFPASLLTAAGIAWLFMRPAASRRILHMSGAGCLFGLAMLAKPSVFPATICFLVAAMVLSEWADRSAALQTMSLEQRARGCSACVLPFVIISLAYFWFGWRHVIDYINEAQFGAHRAVWRMHGSAGKHVLYFLTGEGGQMMLRRHLYLLCIMIAACFVVQLRISGQAASRTAVGLGAMLLLTWLVPTVNLHKQPFFALTFQILLVFVALRLLAATLVLPEVQRWQLPAAICVMTAGIALIHAPPRSDESIDISRDRVRIVDGIYDAVTAHTRSGEEKPGDSRRRVMLTGSGDINAALFTYMARRDAAPLDFSTPADTNDPAPYVAAFDQADYVVAAESKSGMYAGYLLNSPLQDQLLDSLRKRRDFSLAASFTFRKTGRNVYLFRRTVTPSSFPTDQTGARESSRRQRPSTS